MLFQNVWVKILKNWTKYTAHGIWSPICFENPLLHEPKVWMSSFCPSPAMFSFWKAFPLQLLSRSPAYTILFIFNNSTICLSACFWFEFSTFSTLLRTLFSVAFYLICLGAISFFFIGGVTNASNKALLICFHYLSSRANSRKNEVIN